MEEMPMVPDSLSSTNSFATPAQLLPVDPLPDGRHCLSLFASAIPFLPSSASLPPPFDVFPPPLASSVPPPVSFSLPPLPLFLLSTPPVVASLPSRVFSLLPVFILQASACTFHRRNLTSEQY